MMAYDLRLKYILDIYINLGYDLIDYHINMPKFREPTTYRIIYLLVQLFTGTLIISAALFVYQNHPYYIGFINAYAKDWILYIAVILFLILIIDNGIKFFFVKDLPETKLSLIFVYFLKLLVWIFIKKERSDIKLKMTAKTKTAFLATLVKFFFLPIMLNTITNNGAALLSDFEKIQDKTLVINFDVAFAILVTTIFLIDTSVFAFGYTIESKYLNNIIKSVEPTIFGWIIAISTYPPFNSLTGNLIQMYQTTPTFLADEELVLKLAKILIIVLHLTFLSATLALGFKASNLTNRGIVKNGPYAIVRHPAYAAKVSVWFIEGLLFAGTLSYFLGWSGFVIIYILRAITEERHLEQDPDYIEYKKKVKFRFIPYIV